MNYENSPNITDYRPAFTADMKAKKWKKISANHFIIGFIVAAGIGGLAYVVTDSIVQAIVYILFTTILVFFNGMKFHLAADRLRHDADGIAGDILSSKICQQYPNSHSYYVYFGDDYNFFPEEKDFNQLAMVYSDLSMRSFRGSWNVSVDKSTGLAKLHFNDLANGWTKRDLKWQTDIQNDSLSA